MKKILLVLVMGLVLTLSACSGVSQEDYDRLMDQITDLEDEVDTLTGEKSTLEGENSALQNELDSQMVG